MDQQSRDPIGEITISKAKRAGRIIYGQPSGSWQKRSKKKRCGDTWDTARRIQQDWGSLRDPQTFFSVPLCRGQPKDAVSALSL